MKRKIKWVDYGVGMYDTETSTIYLNKCLLADKTKLKAVKEHEYLHGDGMYSLTDLFIDLKGDVGLLWYSLKHPRMLTSLLPIQYYDGKPFINPVSTVWTIMMVMICSIIYMTK